ncbi:MAG TPA: hypothetical protein VGX50_20855 [Longimicrobium sp.]|jgi:hypothetical protein|nr:hypothetical protein [Longimicrobium sp.]
MRRFDHFVPPVAYSTGLLLGRFLVDIVADLLGASQTQGNRMSTAGIEVPLLPEGRLETEEEYAERIRAAIRRGIKAAEEGRVLTHEQAMRRLARWLGD